MYTNGVTQAMTQAVYETETAEKTKKTSKVNYGKTVGEPELSEKAQKYYEKLKQKFSNMDFVLVSPDKKEEAKANAGQYANANRTVVLIDTEKIERMAEDESYRKKYEGIISSSQLKLAQMQKSVGKTPGVKTYGMEINSKGLTSFFAVVDKAQASQKKRIEKKAAQKAEEKKKSEKKAEEKRAEKKKDAKAEEAKKAEKASEEDYVTVSASSIDELLKRINDTIYDGMSDYVQTPEEKLLGQNINFSA